MTLMSDRPEKFAALRRFYRRHASDNVQRRINRRILAFRLLRADMRWKLSSTETRMNWARRRLNLDSAGWLFILGASNSGTTLFTRLLGLHPFIRDLQGEGQRITRALPRPRHFGLGRIWTQRLDAFRWTETDDASSVERCMFDWAYNAPRGDGYVLEKSPPNVVRARWLQQNFQPCRFIVLTRSPYAVCEGICRRKQYDITVAAEHWAKAHDILHEDIPHLSNVLQLTYERLCEDTQNVLQEIESFLSLPQPFDPELLAREFPIHNIDDKPTMIRNFNDQSVARLSADDIDTITQHTESAMRKFDYEPFAASRTPNAPVASD